jgi:hypothetical protein
MQIEKILIIESPIQLAKMIESRPEILDRSSDEDYMLLRYFCDSVDLFVKGCKCDEEENYANMMEVYSQVKTDRISKGIAQCIECDRVEFK